MQFLNLSLKPYPWPSWLLEVKRIEEVEGSHSFSSLVRVEQVLLDRTKCFLGELPKLSKQFSASENLEDQIINLKTN